MAELEELQEQVKLKRLREQVAAKRAESVADPEPVAEPESAPLPETTLTEDVAHIAGGAPQGIAEATMDLPTTAQSLLPKGLRALAETSTKYLGQNASTSQALQALSAVTSQPSLIPETPPSQTLSQDPTVGPYWDAITAENPNVEKHGLVDSARTAAELGVFAPINLLRKGITAAPDIAAGVAGGVGEYMADSETGSLAAIPSAILAAIMRKDPTKATKQALDYVDGPAKPTSDPRRWTGTQATPESPYLVSARENVAAGDKGSLADVVGNDQRLYDIEAGVRSDPHVNRNYVERADVPRENQLAQQLREPFGADLATGRDSTELANRVDYVRRANANKVEPRQARVDERTAPQREAIELAESNAKAAGRASEDLSESAREAVDQAGLPLSTNRRTAETSSDISNFLDAEELAHKKSQIDPAWKAFEGQDAMPVAPLQVVVGEIYNSFDPRIKKAFNQRYGKYFGDIRKNADMTPKEYQAFIKRLKGVQKKEINEEGYSELTDFLSKMDEQVDGAIPLFAEARKTTVDKYDKFYEGRLGKIRSGDVAPERFMESVGRSDEAGAEMGRLLEGTGLKENPQLIFEDLKAVARREGVDQAFLDKYYAGIESLPKEQADLFRNYVNKADASKAADDAATVAARTEKRALDDAATETKVLNKAVDAEKKAIADKAKAQNTALDKTVVRKFSADPDKTLNTLLNGNDDAGLKRLARAVERAGETPQLKARIRDGLEKRKWGKNIDETHRLQKKLVDSGFVTQEEMVTLNDRIYKGTQRELLRKKALEEYAVLSAREGRSLEASLGAAALMKFMPGGSSLILAGAVRRAIKRQLESGDKGKSDATRLVEEFLVNPEAYINASLKGKTEKQAVVSILTKLVGAKEAAEIMNKDEENQ